MRSIQGAWFALLLACLTGAVGAAQAQAASPVNKPATQPALVVSQASQAPLTAVARVGLNWVAVGDHGVALSSHDGITWRQVKQVPVDTLLTSVCFADPQHGWAVGHGGVILSSSDGGESWQLRHRVDKAPALLSVTCLGGGDVVVVGAYGTALRTHDSGQNWQTLHPGQGPDADLHLNAVVVSKHGTLLAVAEGGALFRGVDAPVSASGVGNWSRVDSPSNASLWGALRLRDGALMLYGMGGRIVISRDDGLHWQAVNSGTREALTGAVQLDDGRVVLVGNGGVVALSADASLGQFHVQVRGDRQNLSAVAADGHGGLSVFGALGVVTHRIEPLSQAIVQRR